MKNRLEQLTISFCLLYIFNISIKAVTPNYLFTDHMVLQQGVTIPVWGTGRDGETVKIEFAGQQTSTIVKNRKWMLSLHPVKAGGPYTMTISGDNSIIVNDVLVGEVWVCSGQSNMERQLGPRPPQKPIFEWEKERDVANYPQIREYYVPISIADSAVSDINSKWVVCSPATVSEFSAVGYFFARDLYKALNIPVGIIFSAVGGTPAQYWTSRATLEGNPELRPLVQAYDKALKEYPAKLADYKAKEQELLAKFKMDSALARNENRPLPLKPLPPKDPFTQRHVCGHFNAMIAPLLPYAIKGVVWYQGEANNSHAKQYQTLFPAMINDWRKNWGMGDFPFLFVQVAPFKDMTPELREAQLLSWKKTVNTAMVVTTDCGDANDIHPAYKQPVGHRLALAARALAYNEHIEYSGPVYQSFKIKKHKVILSFSHAKKGLVAKNGKLKGFTIAGSNKEFVSAQAHIKGKTVEVYNDAVKTPVAVRYGWNNVPEVNLYNTEGLPASPFRTDVNEFQ